MKTPKKFFSRSDEFSFKDLLAAAMVGFFVYFSIRALGDSQALELVRVWVTLIAIVLGGYFGQEIAGKFTENREQNRHYSDRGV